MTVCTTLSKLKQRVRAGKPSPMEALDVIVSARKRGESVDPALDAWIVKRIRAVNRKHGTHAAW